jgi:4-alpha-glucanotransferase
MRGKRDSDVERDAVNVGLTTQWRDAFGKTRRVSSETLRALLDAVDAGDVRTATTTRTLVVAESKRPTFAFTRRSAKHARIELEFGGSKYCEVERTSNDTIRLNADLPPGYHTVEIGTATFALAAAPSRCFSVGDATQTNEKLWGIAAQLYSLRRNRDFGFGDFTALTQLAVTAADRGAAALAISPLHAMFGARPENYSPYSPSNRGLLNVLFADASALLGNKTFDSIVREVGLETEIAALQRSRLIDWQRSSALHRKIFEIAFERFMRGELPGVADFFAFRKDGGAALAHHACFEVLDENASASSKPRARSKREKDFAEQHSHRVSFQVFLQWCASRGLASAQAAARMHGMPLGLIADLAVGVDPSGSECWAQPRSMLMGATIGAPPDELNAIGQNWGLTTFSPAALGRESYTPFLSILRAAMRHAGGVRLDHVMSLMRLWLVPNGARPGDGAYLRYPFDDLVRLVALESWRNRCIVIGEDLGTVPPDCRTKLARAGILGLDVLPFMRDGASFLPARKWRGNAVAMTSTHDIAPVAGWWSARDLDWRRKLHLFGERSEKDERDDRTRARAQLALAIKVAHPTPDRIVDAAIDFVNSSPSPLAIVPIEDLVASDEAPNLPGTIGEHPNWRRRYRADAHRLLALRDVSARVSRLARIRRKIR